MEICEALDPMQQMIHGRIGREGTMVENGVYIKDLSYLGRKIPQTIYIDFDKKVVPHHEDNTIIIPEWDGDENDRHLIDLIPFLENAAQAQGDVRELLDEYTHDNTAERFNEMQRRRRDIIIKSRDSGLSGAMGSLGNLQKGPKMNFKTPGTFNNFDD